ncbi:MAG: c-type cytochrome [Deltaproteobacteria bacterium]|nr:c-type cytochrome [Deltaproteobacteria bacterium]
MGKQTTMINTVRNGMAALLLALTAMFPAASARAQQTPQTVEQRLAALESRVVRAEQQQLLELGHQIYEVACMSCHGSNGDGRGPSAKWLNPKPRNFSMGLFKWRSTPYGALPTDEDLERTVRRGVSTTDMPPFGEILSLRSRLAVVQYIKTFYFGFADPGMQPKPADILLIPDKRPFPKSEQTVAKGREHFIAKGCSACHGDQGKGDGPASNGLMDQWGEPIRPWNFTDGYFKSGFTEQDLFRTITNGLNGTPMIAFGPMTSVEERWQLVDYLRSLGAEFEETFFHELFVDEPSGRVYDPEHYTSKVHW